MRIPQLKISQPLSRDLRACGGFRRDLARGAGRNRPGLCDTCPRPVPAADRGRTRHRTRLQWLRTAALAERAVIEQATGRTCPDDSDGKQSLLRPPATTRAQMDPTEGVSGQRVAVLIPCLNEERTVARVIADFHRELPYAQIWVVDNGSTDRTVAHSLEAGAHVLREPRRGKGFAIRAAFRDIEGDVYVLADGDNQLPADAVHALIAPVLNGSADMVVGSRALGGHTGAKAVQTSEMSSLKTGPDRPGCSRDRRAFGISGNEPTAREGPAAGCAPLRDRGRAHDQGL